MKTLHPEFVEMIRSLGPDFPAEVLLRELGGGTSPVSIRLNRAKGAAPLAGARMVPWSGGSGFYLPSRPVFALDPAWHQGLYYVQDASSMALGSVVGELVARYFSDAPAPLRYLDACAAPGGKTLAALDALPADAFVLANEYDFRRASILAENIVKHGAPNVAVSRGDTARLGSLGPQFDIIAADVPCSGEGMMRKDDEAVAQWSPALVRECAERQRGIIANLWPALRTGGFLIYSTCTFNRAENEENVAWIADTYGAESVATSLTEHAGVCPGIDTPHACCRFIPGAVDGEGLFIAVLRKTSGDGDAVGRTRRGKGRRGAADKCTDKPADAAAFVRRHLGDGFLPTAEPDGTVSAVRVGDAAFAATLRGNLDLLLAGVTAGCRRGRELAPCHALAMSAALRSGTLPRVDMDYAAAMAYLHGDAPDALPEGTPRGYILPCYGGIPLGTAKCVGRRANNLYPDQWRLRLNVPADAPAPVISMS